MLKHVVEAYLPAAAQVVPAARNLGWRDNKGQCTRA
jgi:hypothetical protein